MAIAIIAIVNIAIVIVAVVIIAIVIIAILSSPPRFASKEMNNLAIPWVGTDLR